ncbi:MAG: bifunctional phosphopantothenoylcysteine decarboxylase/phosphopantothenate--cysteine ligase CoaBC [Acidobacteria bacterium]|nr:bifunctional phosphopantothenoylcysteine decarboxylase/phosphopantothenate--cysteine ligase CoaBC [Acidobacteriota bacterium]
MRVVLGITGGIAAYKAAEVARSLMERGVAVQAVMTAGAQEFVRPLTFAALTGRKVITDMFGSGGADETLASSVEHIRVAQENDLLLVAPATADVLAKFAHGLADDFLSTLYLAFTGPVAIAPAMNTNMWRHPATQANLEILRKRGHVIVDPGDGLLACGTSGPGRLAEPEAIVAVVDQMLHPRRDLEGETILITAGPTQEPLDPVRYVSNRSSGKMGFSLAEAAAARGAQVVLVSGPVHLEDPVGVSVERVRTAREMYDAVMAHLPESTIIVKSAAVADYYRADLPKQKVKKTATLLSLELQPTPDILAEAGRRKGDRLLVGFAAETENLLEEARRKMTTKNCDMVVANLVSQAGIGFETDENEVTLVLRSGEAIPLKRASKRHIADQIFDQIAKLRLAAHASR